MVSPPGIAIPPAGLFFTHVTFFFKSRPYHSTPGEWIATRIAGLTPMMIPLYTDAIPNDISWINMY